MFAGRLGELPGTGPTPGGAAALPAAGSGGGAGARGLDQAASQWKLFIGQVPMEVRDCARLFAVMPPLPDHYATRGLLNSHLLVLLTMLCFESYRESVQRRLVALALWQCDTKIESERALQATEQDLWALFAPLGEVLELYVLRNNQTGRSRGCAFVTYSSRHLAQQVTHSKRSRTSTLATPLCGCGAEWADDMLLLCVCSLLAPEGLWPLCRRVVCLW